jgi:hypothetical protein
MSLNQRPTAAGAEEESPPLEGLQSPTAASFEQGEGEPEEAAAAAASSSSLPLFSSPLMQPMAQSVEALDDLEYAPMMLDEGTMPPMSLDGESSAANSALLNSPTPQPLPHIPIAQLQSPRLAARANRPSRPRDGDEGAAAVDADVDEEDANGMDSSARPSKKQRRSSTRPPPPPFEASTAAAAASPAMAVMESQQDASESEQSKSDSEESDEEADEEASNDASEAEEALASDDEESPGRRRSKAFASSVFGAPSSAYPQLGTAAQPLLIDEDAAASPRSDFDDAAPTEIAPSELFAETPFVNVSDSIDLTEEGEETVDASAAASSMAPAGGFIRKSLTSALFGGAAMPASSFNPFAHVTQPLTKPNQPAGTAPMPSILPGITPVAPPSNSVDLRANSSDDEASDNKLGTVLCLVYGTRICPGKAIVNEQVFLTRLANGADPNAIRVDNVIAQPCGVLNKDTAAALAPLLDQKLVRVEARVGHLSAEEMGLRIELYAQSKKGKIVEKHLSKYPMVNYLSLLRAKKPLPSDPAAAAAAGGVGGLAGAGGEFGASATGASAPGTGLSVREIESDLDQLFGGEVDLALMPLAEPPACVRTHLHPYQRQVSHTQTIVTTFFFHALG